MAVSKDDIKKILFLGDGQVGKTALLSQWVNAQFAESYIATIGIDVITNTLNCPTATHADDSRLVLQIWDTAGQERFKTMTPAYYKAANLAVLVFDITHRASFEKLPSILEELQAHAPNLPCMIIANKIDLADQRSVSQQESFQYAEQIGALYVESTGRTATGVSTLETSLLHYFAGQKTSSKEAKISQDSFTDLHNKIRQFEQDWQSNPRMLRLAAMLKEGLEVHNKQFYFETKLPELQTQLNQLRDTCSTVFNMALNLIITVLLALTIVGLPIAYCTGLLTTNEKKHGHMLTFFAFGAQQSARALCLEVLDRTDVTLSMGG